MDQVLKVRIIVLCSVVLVACVSIASANLGRSWYGYIASAAHSAKNDTLTVAFLDVGQGDAIYIETPDGVQALIDGGPDSSVLRELPRVMPWFDRSLDVVVATHPDKDHIAGLVDVLARYEVATIVRTENESDTAVSSAFILVAAEEAGATTHFARAGDVLALGASTTLTLFSPASNPAEWESNNSSIVARLTYGEADFLLTGDAGVGIEEYLVATYGTVLESEVLKLGHHGSDTSTSPLFLHMVSPLYAVVLAGADNRYGHPHRAVVERVVAAGSQLVSTADSGTIVFKSDGVQVWREE